MRKYQKYLFFTIGICLILYFFELLVLFGARNTVTDNDGKINLLVKHKLDPDIMIFGSSVAQFHLDPKIIKNITEKSTFNFGLAGTTFIQYRGLLSEFIQYSGKCKLIIITLLPSEFANRNKIFKFYDFTAHINNPQVYNSLFPIEPALLWRTKYIPFYKLTCYNSDFYSITFKGWQHYFAEKNNIDTLSGYKPQNMSWVKLKKVHLNANSEVPIFNKKETASEYSQIIDTSLVNEMKQNIEEFNNKGGKIILLLSPIYYQYSERINNDINPTTVKDIQKLSKKLTGTINYFFDYSSDSLTYHKECFYNYTHLNAKGSKLFSIKIARDLKKILMLN